MVVTGEGREGESEEAMEMRPERSKLLHNFTMPCLKWGNQRLFRCVKANSNGKASTGDRRSPASGFDKPFVGRRTESDSERRRSVDRAECAKKSPPPAAGVGVSGGKLKVVSDGDDGIDAVRAKLMHDLQTAADKMKFAILKEGLEEGPAAAAEGESARPWNLRSRRPACNARNGVIGVGSNGGGGKSSKGDDRKINSSPMRTEIELPRSKDVPAAEAAIAGGETKKRAKFSVSLSRREIEEDFMAIVGQRPPRRPKKRPKIVQRQLDSLFPGLWLTEVTAEIYKVPDAPETTGKK